MFISFPVLNIMHFSNIKINYDISYGCMPGVLQGWERENFSVTSGNTGHMLRRNATQRIAVDLQNKTVLPIPPV